jgi:hypothetical protein
MYTVSTAYTAAAEANARQILTKALFNDETKLSGDNIISMAVTEAVNASGGLSMGSTISSKLTMSLKMPETPLLLDGGFVAPAVGFAGVMTGTGASLASDGVLTTAATSSLDEGGTLVFSVTPALASDGAVVFAEGPSEIEYCPLGKFYITEATSKNDFKTIFEIVAYDGFCKTEGKYKPTIAMPNTAKAILKDIAAQCHFGLATGLAYPSGKFELYDWTCREYIGYLAGLAGKNARFDRDGNLTFVWYTDAQYNVDRDLQFMGGFKRLTSADFTMRSITSGSSDNTLTSGTGVGISFENPLMKQEILDQIFADVGPVTYTPANLKWRGNPAIEAGDIIAVNDKDGRSHVIYIMEQTIKIGGGLRSEIKCYGESDAAIGFDTTPQSKKLQQVYTKLQDAIKSATELLNGSNGGVFEVTDTNADGINDGWIIHSADGQRFIKANVNGIGITTDGGATYKQAMTTDGINASAITVGSLNAERIAVENYDENEPTKLTDYIRFGDGTITLGKGDSAIILKLENDQIAFYNTAGTRLACFTNNSFELENLEDGQIRFQNFGFIPRSSGNLSFTKLK